MDWDEKAYQLQPRNALHRLKKWDGQDEDRQLIHLATFLRSSFFSLSLLTSIFSILVIAASGVEDVRDVLDHYNQEPDPIQTFLLRQQALLVRSNILIHGMMRLVFFCLGSGGAKTTSSS